MSTVRIVKQVFHFIVALWQVRLLGLLLEKLFLEVKRGADFVVSDELAGGLSNAVHLGKLLQGGCLFDLKGSKLALTSQRLS